METIITNSNVIITATSNLISCSDGKSYHLVGNNLVGPMGVISHNVRSTNDAINIVIGQYGGRKT